MERRCPLPREVEAIDPVDLPAVEQGVTVGIGVGGVGPEPVLFVVREAVVVIVVGRGGRAGDAGRLELTPGEVLGDLELPGLRVRGPGRSRGRLCSARRRAFPVIARSGLAAPQPISRHRRPPRLRPAADPSRCRWARLKRIQARPSIHKARLLAVIAIVIISIKVRRTSSAITSQTLPVTRLRDLSGPGDWPGRAPGAAEGRRDAARDADRFGTTGRAKGRHGSTPGNGLQQQNLCQEKRSKISRSGRIRIRAVSEVSRKAEARPASPQADDPALTNS